MRELPFYLLALVSLSIKTVLAICPNMCICDIDERGRKRTRCEDGGITLPGTFDIQQLDQDVEVLIVSGSRQRPNSFLLNSGLFQGKRLKELHLSFSGMDTLGERPFYPLSGTLEVLNLTWNALRYTSENNFRNLSKLTHLHLDHNRMETAFSAMLNYLTGLKVLTMSDNKFREIPQRMGLQLSKLEELDLSSNPLSDNTVQFNEKPVPDTFFVDLPSLRILKLANTSIDGLPWAAIQKNCINLEEIDLSRNRIPDLRQQQLSLLGNRLKRVSLAGNPIRNIQPNALSGLRLEKLDLSGLNAGILVPGVFQGAVVRYLDISNMGLTTWNNEVFLPISQDLWGLNISGNPALPLESKMLDVFPVLRHLTMRRMEKNQPPINLLATQGQLDYLDLSENGFSLIEDGFFDPLSNLLYLNLGSNRLTQVPKFNLPRIQNIDLANNQLQAFPDSLASTLASPSSQIQSLHLNNNPWNCDCGVASLGRWLQKTDGRSGQDVICRDFTCPVCSSPAQLAGTSLDRLPPSFLDTCAPLATEAHTGTANVDVIIAVVVCLIVLIIAVLLLVLWYRNRLHSYRTYEEKRKDTDIYDQNGDAEVFAEEPPPISKPKSAVPGGFSSPTVVKPVQKGAESDV